MTVDIETLAKRISPENTVLLFGAGSSVPSGAPTSAALSDMLADHFQLLKLKGSPLIDIASIIEKKFSRRDLIARLQKIIEPLRPTRGVLNLPLFEWREIYTTNYDTLIEQAFEKSRKPIRAISTNFDLTADALASGQCIYKLHGTIERDVSLGDMSRIVISQNDYDQTETYRESLFDRFKDQINRSDLVIVGSSLTDQDLKDVVNRSVRMKREGAQGRTYLLAYNSDPDLASLFEDRGLVVCFGGIDEFVDQITRSSASLKLVASATGDPLDVAPQLRTAAIDVSHSLASEVPNAGKLFQGRPARYGDIAHGLAFPRDLVPQIESQFVSGQKHIAILLGVAGVGKTTLCRQLLSSLVASRYVCWEHDPTKTLDADKWLAVAKRLKSEARLGVLLIDDCHEHLRSVNALVESLHSANVTQLRLMLVSNPPAWNPRVKSPVLFQSAQSYRLRQLSPTEIDGILNLVESNPSINALVQERFAGFQKAEKRRRLLDRCGADTFVCMKNIFAFDAMDDIVLQEYAELDDSYRDIYRIVAAMEASGVQVHRQFLIRSLGINANSIAAILANLSDIISESQVDPKEGIYAWSGRHIVISEILSKHEFRDQDELFELLCRIADNINPAYQIELRTVRELCGRRFGISQLRDVRKQNLVLRKLISIAPGERVPRHRLISNLIDMKDFAGAESEIRFYEKDLRSDPVLARYQIILVLRRAEASVSLLPEHRASIARDAAQLAEQAISRFASDKNIYEVYLQVGRFVFALSGKWDVFDTALTKAKQAEARILDPDLTRTVSKFEMWALRAQGN